MTAQVVMEYAPPPADMRDWISSLYALRQDSPVFDEVERADRPQFRVLINGGGEYRFSDGSVSPAYPVTIVGPTTGTLRAVGHGPMHVVGAGLLPAAWVALVGNHAERAVNTTLDAQVLLGDSVGELRTALCDASDTAAQFALLCQCLKALVSAAGEAPSMRFIAAMDAWLSGARGDDVAALITATGLSMRQVERMSKRYYGLPPKSLARKYRALRAAAALARGDDLDALGIGEQFYDQSHLIRELKQFAGLTPKQIRERQSALLEAVSKGRKSLTGQVSPLVSDA